MMNYLTALFIVSMLASCSQHHSEETSHTEAHAAPTELALNGEERWQADDATNANMEHLQQLMMDHLRQPDANSVEAVNELGQEMKAGFDKVFKDCRMKGPEHDMLHTYLMPMLDDVKTLETSEQQTATAARDRLAERLDQYQTYFK